MRLLVTAFEPFGGRGTHQSGAGAVRALPSSIAGAEVVTLEVPTVFG